MKKSSICSATNKALNILFLLVISILFTVFFCGNVTNIFYGYDQACFYTVGTGMANGMVPYRDFFDNKGFIVYLVYMLPQLFTSSKLGFVAVEIIWMFFELLFIGKAAEKIGVKYRFVPQIFYLFINAVIECGGGYSEDINNLFVAVSFYLLADFISKYGKSDEKVKPYYGLLLGIMFALSFMTRVNNMVPIASICLGVVILLIIKKNIKGVFICAGTFIAGVAVVLLPVSLYLLKENAFSDWLYQTILINFSYASGSNTVTKSELLLFNDYGYILFSLVTLGLLALFIAKYSGFKSEKDKVFTLISFLSLMLSVASCLLANHNFRHYIIVCYIPFVSSMMCVFNFETLKTKKSGIKIAGIVLAFTLMFISFRGFTALYNGICNAKIYADKALSGTLLSPSSEIEKSKELLDIIPEDDRDSVMPLIDIRLEWFANTELLPCRRLFVSYELFREINPELREEYSGYFTAENRPKWILSPYLIEDIEYEEIRTSIDGRYEYVDKIENIKEDTNVYVYRAK